MVPRISYKVISSTNENYQEEDLVQITEDGKGIIRYRYPDQFETFPIEGFDGVETEPYYEGLQAEAEKLEQRLHEIYDVMGGKSV